MMIRLLFLLSACNGAVVVLDNMMIVVVRKDCISNFVLCMQYKMKFSIGALFFLGAH